MHVNGRLAPATLVIAAFVAGCAATSPRPSESTRVSPLGTPSPAPTRTPVADGDGTVVGGLYRCYALPPPTAPKGVAGTVSVFQGPNDGLPDEVVTTDGTYALDLPPGHYVLVGHSTGSNLAPPMARVVVSSGTITHQDLDYQGCK
jgi:hypothetical protein